jgi:hypothetical protein
MIGWTASQLTTSQLTPKLLVCLFLFAPTPGWSDDDLITMTPLALAFAAAEAVKAMPSDYHYAIDYQSLGVNFTGTLDPTAAEGQRLDVLSSSIAKGTEPKRLDKVTVDLDRAAGGSSGVRECWTACRKTPNWWASRRILPPTDLNQCQPVFPTTAFSSI